MKRMLAVAMVLIVGVTMISFASGGGSGTTTSEPTKITVGYAAHPNDTLDFSLPWYVEWQKRANAEINFIVFPAESVDEKRNLVLASGDIPDITNVTSTIANTYGPDGLFEPLDDLAAKVAKAPFLKELFADPKMSYHLRAPNDEIYMVPSYNELAASAEGGIAYRAEVLKELGLSEPTTMDGWYEVFKTVKQKTDLIPLSGGGGWMPDAMKKGFGPAFDMGFELYQLDYGMIISEIDREKVVYLPGTDEFRTYLRYLNKLYSEGLLDQEYLTKTYADWWDGTVAAGKEFMQVTNTWRANYANTSAADVGVTVSYDTALLPINPVTGKRLFTRTGNPWTTNGMAISADSDVKEQAFELLDYFFTDEGDEFFYYGIENVSYGRDSDGKPTIVDWDDRLVGTKRYEIGYANQIVNTVRLERFLIGIDPIVPAHFNRMTPLMHKYPILKTTGSEFEEMTNLLADLKTYAEEMQAKFIAGRVSLDSDWDSYLTQLKKLKADRGADIVQVWYDDYAAFIGN